MRHLALVNDLMYQLDVERFLLTSAADAAVTLDHGPHPVTMTSAEIVSACIPSTDAVAEGVVNKYFDASLIDGMINASFTNTPPTVNYAGAVLAYWGSKKATIVSFMGKSVEHVEIENKRFSQGVFITDGTYFDWRVVSGKFYGVPEENVTVRILGLVNYTDSTINSSYKKNTGGDTDDIGIFLIGELKSSGYYQVYLSNTYQIDFDKRRFLFCNADEFEPSSKLYSDAKFLEIGGDGVASMLDHVDNYPHHGIIDSITSNHSVLSARYLHNVASNLLHPSMDDFYWDGAWRAGFHESLLAPAGSGWLFTGEGCVKDAATGVILVESVNNGKLLGMLHPTSDVTLELDGNVVARRLDHFHCTMEIGLQNA